MYKKSASGTDETGFYPPDSETMGFPPIENHGLIGNRRTAALVSHQGSIDLYCPFGFDSPSVFARILDENGGHFEIRHPTEAKTNRNLYLPDSGVLISRFGEHGVCEIWDFFAATEELGRNVLIRRLKGITGEARLCVNLVARFSYGRIPHRTEKIPGGFKLTPRGKAPPLFLYTDVQGLEIERHKITGLMTLQSHETRYFVLTERKLDSETIRNLKKMEERELALGTEETQRWVGRSGYRGRWQDEVNRSALTLRHLISKDHGSMVAAPSFSLPAIIGGDRNWDYRFVWIRDNSLAFRSLMLLGFSEDVKSYMSWLRPLLHGYSGKKALQPLFSLNYRRDLKESTLDHWSGYKSSSPVRIGNLAWSQVQMDVYGELLRFLCLYDETVECLSHDDLLAVRRLLAWLGRNWREKDHSIWEERARPRQYLYSKVMAWVAFKKGIELFQRRAAPAELNVWRGHRDDIHDYIYTTFWRAEGAYFRRAEGDDRVDASALIMPLEEFISVTDPRWTSTLEKIEDELLDDCLVHRFRPRSSQRKKSHKEEEGTFGLSTFWYAECLAQAGHIEQARYIFERMLGFANPLGLFSEEVGLDGSHLGNFPLNLTHASLISAALSLEEAIQKWEKKNGEKLFKG